MTEMLGKLYSAFWDGVGGHTISLDEPLLLLKC